MNILLLVIREIQEKSMNSRLGSLSYAASLCFCCHGAGSSILHISPWHFTVQIVLLLLTLCKTPPPHPLCTSLCGLQYARVPHQHRRAICRHKAPCKPTGFIRWGGEVKNHLLAGCSEEPEKEEPPWEKRGAPFFFILMGALISTACCSCVFLTKQSGKL